MKLGFYPGCSLNGTAKEFNSSLREVFSTLNVNLEELNDWSCCGATSAHVTSHLLSVALPARNLMIAKKQGFEDLLAPCAACYSRLVSSQKELKLDEKMRMKVESLLEEKVMNGLQILNLIQIFQKIGLDKLKEKKQVDISSIKAACYYGCLLVRPVDIAVPDDMESPDSMEAIIKSVGGKTVDWNFKTECCGAAHSITHTDIVEKLCKGIIDNAAKHDADVIIVACPMCHSNLDMRQLNIIKHFNGHKPVPVLYLSQLIGLAMGIDEKKLGLDVHYINTKPLLEKIKQGVKPPGDIKAPQAPPLSNEKIAKGVEV
jgi:heterodisulfide reductase subunit B2